MKNDPLVEILKKNFEQKKARNKAYSLRSYSRDLGLDPSNLSKIMNYQKEVGSRLRLKLGKLMGFEKMDIEGWLKPTLHTKTTNKDYSAHPLQILEGAIEALEQVPIELRSQSSMTMAIDSRKLNQARELIKNFRRDLGRLMSASGHLDQVYQLSISLYPVTHIQSHIHPPKKGEKQ